MSLSFSAGDLLRNMAWTMWHSLHFLDLPVPDFNNVYDDTIL